MKIIDSTFPTLATMYSEFIGYFKQLNNLSHIRDLLTSTSPSASAPLA